MRSANHSLESLYSGDSAAAEMETISSVSSFDAPPLLEYGSPARIRWQLFEE